MKLDLDAARLRAAGIRRVVLAAGSRDDTHDAMQALAHKMDGAGVEARFVDLGPVDHATFPPDMDARMCAALAWVRGDAQGRACDAAGLRPTAASTPSASTSAP